MLYQIQIHYFAKTTSSVILSISTRKQIIPFCDVSSHWLSVSRFTVQLGLTGGDIWILSFLSYLLGEIFPPTEISHQQLLGYPENPEFIKEMQDLNFGSRSENIDKFNCAHTLKHTHHHTNFLRIESTTSKVKMQMINWIHSCSM